MDKDGNRRPGERKTAKHRFALDDIEAIDRIVHEPARLSIMAYLSVLEEADFVYLRNVTGLTKGNLGSHISRLEDAGYVSVEKRFEGKTPRTFLRLTPEGRAALESWRDAMDSIVRGLS